MTTPTPPQILLPYSVGFWPASGTPVATIEPTQQTSAGTAYHRLASGAHTVRLTYNGPEGAVLLYRQAGATSWAAAATIPPGTDGVARTATGQITVPAYTCLIRVNFSTSPASVSLAEKRVAGVDVYPTPSYTPG